MNVTHMLQTHWVPGRGALLGQHTGVPPAPPVPNQILRHLARRSNLEHATGNRTPLDSSTHASSNIASPVQIVVDIPLATYELPINIPGLVHGIGHAELRMTFTPTMPSRESRYPGQHGFRRNRFLLHLYWPLQSPVVILCDATELLISNLMVYPNMMSQLRKGSGLPVTENTGQFVLQRDGSRKLLSFNSIQPLCPQTGLEGRLVLILQGPRKAIATPAPTNSTG